MIPSFTYRIREILWGAVQASVISKKQILSLFALLCFVNLSIAQTTQTFSSSGTWLAPAGVTTLKVECWGGGGRGGSTSFSSNETGGGGGGAYARLNAYVLAPGTTYTVTVGTGSTTASAGGDSWFNTNSTVLAKGGSSVANNGTSGANGGSSASSIGDVKFAGGNGANGSNNNYGGGGGSSAGTAAAGANGSTSNGGNAPSGGGNGGNGRTGSNGNGLDGSIPGGGGGGVRSGTFGSQTGGDGANGRVILTWTCPTYNISSTSVAASVCIGSAASISLTSSAAGLPAGTYTVTYSLSGANTGTGLTASMTVSSAGTGSFSTGVLANSGSTTITITQLSSGAGAAICNSSITANNTATISVGVVNAGSISGTQSTCFGGDPTLISNSVSGSGAGTITYTWESSTTSATAGFSSISGATADSYDPPAGLSVTTWYRRITISTDGAAVCQATSNAIQVTVSTTQLPTISAASSSSLTCAGGPFNLFANTNAGYSATVSPALAIPDNLSSGITSTITTSGLPTSLTGWQVIVTVNITHTWTSDIELFLARPGGGFGSGNATNHVGTIAGQSIRLSNDNGGSGDGYANCTFRDDAATNVTTQSGNVTISGNYIPEELLSTLSGNPNGNWTLRVSDDAADDTGTLTSWTLQIVYPNGLSYSWSSTPSGFTSAVQNPTGVSANENTTYTVVQTDLNTGCTQSSSVTVNTIANPAPKVIPGDSVLCSGTDLYVHVIDTGAYSGGYPVGSLLEWVNIVANQNVLDSLNVNGNGSIYQAIITTPDGCTGISPVRTILSKSILPNETITHATCNLPNGKIVTNMVMGTAPFHYVWKSGSIVLKDTVSSSPLDSIFNLATGSYTLEVSDNFGNVNPLEPSCNSIVFTYTVNEIAPPSVNVTGTDISCFGMNDGQATATPGLGTAPYSYLWSNSETTQSIINLGPGTYTVTVTDVTGCSSEGQITIIEPSEIIISLNYTEPLCTGSLTGVVYSNVSGGTLPYNYEWFDSGFLPEGLNDDTLLNVGADTYFLVITDANGCIASNSILVEDPPLLTATCSATPATCFGGGDGTVSLLSSGGRGFHTYLWSTGDVTTSVTGLEAGTYTATVTDGNGCTAICTAVVSQPDVVSGIVTGSDVNCINDQTSVVVTATGGTGPYTGEGTFTVGVGTHTFPLTDINGCTGSASITINHLDVDAPVISDCPSDITQCGDIATWVSPTAIDNCTLVSFTSDFNSGASFPVGTTLVTYTATDNAGLVSTCSFNVTILPTPIWYADADGDGFGNPAISLVDCIQPVGYISDNTDCDDSQILYADNDGDLFGAGSPAACGVPVNGDCDDNNAAVNPAATEVCNSIDDDCDGLTDEGVLLTFYADTDADSYGDAAVSTQACSAPVGYVADNTDCDDNNPAVNPAAVEICNAIDDDCNGLTDDGLVFLNYYVDGDNDGFGAGAATSSCNPIAGSVLVDGDCDDNNAAVNPAATEVCNGIDDDCDGLTEEGLTFLDYYVDGDNDGFGAGAATSSCNPIAGSVLVDGDCDDNNAAVNPAATEVCNGIDDDCDGLTEEGLTFLDYYVDGDNDGFGAGVATSSCNPIAGSVLVDGDCDDNNAAVNPAATEVCNGIDDDCDGLTEEGLTFLDYYVDGDNDGFGSGAATSSCNPIAGSVLVDGDCDDNNAAVNPAAVEICNAIDDDCNGLTDDGLVFLNYYVDGDNDGFGAGAATSSCNPIAGSVLVDGDCDDNNAAVNPAATEVCNGIDDDCDGLTEEGLTFLDYYVDGDNDGFGAGVATSSCAPIAGSVLVDGDCDDNNAAVNPAATEVCNSIDDDCDGSTDEGVLLTFYADADADSYGNAAVSAQACSAPVGYVADNTDCDDNNAAVNPAAIEICNSIDDDCDGSTDEGVLLTFYADADADSYGNAAVSAQACSAPVGYVADNTDCDDSNLNINPGATEVCGNSIDDNCDTNIDEGCILYTYFADTDNDSYGDPLNSVSNYVSIPPAGYVADNTDCDDNNAAVNPAATEICNSIDDDCDGSTDEGVLLTFYADADADSYGNAAVSAQACSAPVGYVADNTDCDDNNAAVNPAAVEICNSIDDDCNGLTDDGLVFLNYYVDGDNDGFGAGAATSSCAPIAGSVLVDGDCDDNNAAVNPAAVEICNAIDDDCNGLTDDGLVFLNYYVDGDNDGFGAGVATSSCAPIAGSVLVDGDCDDNNAAVNPAATEICNSIDDDCDGSTDEGVLLTFYADVDADSYGNAAVSTQACSAPVGYVADNTDCDDNNAAVNPAAVEICNSIDDDCNGLTDDGLVFLNYYVDGDNDGFGAGAATSSCAPIAGSVLVDGDCDDNNAAVNPAATEICNSIDDDCDGSTDEGVLLTFYADVDADSYGNAAVSTQACSAPVGYVADNTDCDDNNAAVNPAAVEICNSIDDDCNGLTDDGLVFLNYYVDGDNDGFGAGAATSSCAPIAGSVLVDGDCDDNNAAVNPAATEICNSIDDDCDGSTDEGVLLTFYADVDADSYGNAAVSTQACSAPVGYVADNTDCDDNNAAVNPAAVEICNSIDDDCNGLTDDGLVFLNYYVDGDNDGFGAGAATSSCAPIAGSVLVDGDCDDNNAAVNPAAVEICNAIDDDCNGLTDDGLVFLNYYVDGDNDGFGAGVATSSCAPIAGSVLVDGDCDDNNAAVNPAATEICNSIDDDCDGSTDEGVLLTFYADVDADSYGNAAVSTQACSAPVGYVADNTDCDDNNAAVNPAAVEICNSIDDDCNGLTDDGLVFLNYYVDGDNDGFGAGVATSSCAPIAGSVLVDGDCDDNNAAVNPAAVEICNSIDDDCNGLTDDGLVFLNYYVDGDNDGFGAGAATSSCAPIAGSVLVDGDCDDNNAAVNPAAVEICNAIDDDCNGLTDDGLVFLNYYVDGDNDGFGAGVATSSCAPIAGSVLVDGDCDDNNAAVNPAAVEICNSIDDDCNGLTDDGLVFLNYYVDGDNDGFGAGAATSSCAPITGSVLVDGDCDDNNAAVNPAATEICNSIDDDCNGLTDDGLVFLNYYVDGDNDGFGAGAATSSCAPIAGSVLVDGDCDDNNAAVNPAAVEICNSIDDDCNGLTDDGLVFLNYYVDGDNDGFGAGVATSSCAPIAGSVLVDGDCDDNNAAVNPAATEICNSIDDDCDGSTDEGVLLTFYADADADSYGNAAVSAQACSAPVGYVADNTDCDDNNAAVNPAAVEICNAIDDDCNGLTDDGLVFLNYYVDGDNDGFGAGVATSSCAPIAGSVLVDGDCDDNNAAVNPAAVEICNSIDDDCNGLTDDGLVFLNYYVDGDNDGFGAGAATSSCAPIAGSVLVDGDCDDNNAAVNPAAVEICNSIDDDCNGLTDDGLVFLNYYVDGDNDGFGAGVATSSCAPIAGSVLVDGDCDDNNAAVNPAATEICNSIDDDCDGSTDEGVLLTFFADADADSYGNAAVSTQACSAPVGYVADNTDCDDNNAAVNPAAVEICNSIDDDCNGLTDDGLVFLNYYVDGDNDGFGAGVATSSCNPIAGSVLVDGDCDDNNAAVNPAAVEICNSIDDDCNGLTDDGLVFLNYYVDGDNDGFGAGAATSSCAPIAGSVLVDGDCDDNNAAVNPAATEICNSIDDDCDGSTDEGVLLTFYADVDADSYGNAAVSTQACSAPVGYVADNSDCDDNNAAVNPAAVEICNSIDDDCNGLTDDGLVFLNYYVDGDNDGFGAGVATSSCAPIAGSVLVDGDCDDNNAAVNPAATEICNSIDDDCDGSTDEGVLLTFFADADADSYGNAAVSTQACSAPVGYVADNTDCDDNNAAVNPAATEICNAIDDDCNGSTDEGVLLTFYADVDADSYGNAAVSTQACSAPVGYVADNTDCDDNNAAVNPAAVEICNSIDDDCNGLTDDGLVFLNYYVDGDNDGFGAGAATSSCAPIAGSVLVDGDCDDNNAAVNPAAVEICNAIDDDCNGLTDDGLVFLNYYVDGDNDGFGAGVATSSCAPIASSVLVDGDCDDNNAAVNPAATEICNSIDDDCDGSTDEGVLLTFFADADADSYGNAAVSAQACSAPVGYVADNTDCDDNNAAVNPAAVEICNAIDDDCNGLTDDGLIFLNYYVDGDNDGFGAGAATSSCAPIAGSVLVDGDCDDNNAAVNPAATEICNSIDDDCNGLTDDGLVFLNYYVDGDNDGFGAGAATSSCAPIAGSVLVDGDCDDNNAAVNPAAVEICNSIDDDCNGLTDDGLVFLNYYVDGDNDGFGAGAATSSCAPIAGSVLVDGDCDDNNAAVNPAATEICNSIDDDCDGSTDEGVLLTFFADADADSYGNAAVSTQACSAPVGYVADNTDCDDNNAAVNPAAVEICNSIDDDCNGLTDDGLVFLNYYVDGDNDGFGAGAATSSCAPIAGSVLVDGDCDDNNAAVNPAAVEICNAIDDDCNGLTDDGLVFLNYYVDGDNDGFGAGVATSSCAPIAGSVLVDGDCDDNNAAVNPAAVEICNSIDDDCNGLTDDGLVFLNYYVDGDNDGFGAGAATSSCAPIAGSVLVDGDCDDNNAAVNPAAVEICNSIDDDCNGLTDDGLVFLNYYVDGDNDGFGAGAATSSCAPIAGSVLVDGDCDDNNAAVNPAAVEICNSIDDDCNGLTDDGLVFLNYYVDGDNDGFGAGAATSSCAPIAGSVLVDGDCDDNNAAVNPAATEICNSIDDDCDGSTDEGVLLTFYADVDADSYGNAAVSTQACSAPVGYVADNTDCDDNNAAVNPAAVEICNSIDDDCNGLTDDGLVFLNYYVDGDNDGFGAGAATSSCAPIAGSVLADGDCDDNNGAINPGAAEICNNIDDNCNGLTDDGLVFLDYFTDADNDGFGAGAAISSCTPVSGAVLAEGDCDDNNNAVHPGATELCNGIDDDCDGLTDDNVFVPLGNISGPAQQCVPATFSFATFSIAAPAGANFYNWTVPNGMSIYAGQGTNSVLVTWTGPAVHAGISGPMTVTVGTVCGGIAVATVDIDINYTNPVLPPSISGPSKVCPGDVVTYSVSNVARAKTYNWTVPAGLSIISGQGTNVITASVSGGYSGGSISVFASNFCGNGPARNKTITFNTPLIPAPIVGQASGLCGATNISFTTAGSANATGYNWTVPAGVSIVSGQGSNTILVDVVSGFVSGSITVTGVNGCGTGSTRSLSIIGAPGQAAPISGPTAICPGATNIIYEVPTIAGATNYTWTVPGSATIISGQGTKQITVNYNALQTSNQVITVRASNGCGLGAIRSLSGISINSVNCGGPRQSLAMLKDVIAYPNPATDVVNIQFYSEESDKYIVRILDLSGRTIYMEEGFSNTGENSQQLNVADLASGIYYVELTSAGQTEKIKLMVE